MPGRLTLLLTSPRVVAGILSRDGWRALENADLVAGGLDEPQVQAVQETGMPVTQLPHESGAQLARALLARAGATADNQVVWIGSSDGDPGLTDALAAEVSRLPDPPEVEVVLGSHDAQGSRLLDLVAVMDRLRSPGGCPWDAEQTHESLVPYLLEEAHEAAEALESGDRGHMVEELGDVLLQVAFHARVAEDHAREPFDIDDVAGAIVAKLVRRHPHVFAEGHEGFDDADEVETSWEAIKAAEREHRQAADGEPTAPSGTDLLHGIPAAMPSLARAAKVVGRLDRAGQASLVDEVASVAADPGSRLLALVAELRRAGVDPDAALRSALRQLTGRVGGPATHAEPLG